MTKALTTEDPRVEMKRVRQDVKRFMKSDRYTSNTMPHLGNYPSNMADARRTIIALQDLLDKSMTRHKKATKKILEQKQMFNVTDALDSVYTQIVEYNKQQAQNEITQLKEKLKAYEEASILRDNYVTKLENEYDELMNSFQNISNDKQALARTMEIMSTRIEDI